MWGAMTLIVVTTLQFLVQVPFTRGMNTNQMIASVLLAWAVGCGGAPDAPGTPEGIEAGDAAPMATVTLPRPDAAPDAAPEGDDAAAQADVAPAPAVDAGVDSGSVAVDAMMMFDASDAGSLPPDAGDALAPNPFWAEHACLPYIGVAQADKETLESDGTCFIDQADGKEYVCHMSVLSDCVPPGPSFTNKYPCSLYQVIGSQPTTTNAPAYTCTI